MSQYSPGVKSEIPTERGTVGHLWNRNRVQLVKIRPITMVYSGLLWFTSSTAQGGGGSFKNRKPIGELGCCESGMAERSHWWTERCLRSPLFLSLSDYLPTYLSIFYVSIYLSIYLYLSLSLSNYLSIYLSTYLSIPLSLSLSLSVFLSSVYLSSCLSVYLPIYLSVCLPVYAVSFSVM